MEPVMDRKGGPFLPLADRFFVDQLHSFAVLQKLISKPYLWIEHQRREGDLFLLTVPCDHQPLRLGRIKDFDGCLIGSRFLLLRK